MQDDDRLSRIGTLWSVVRRAHGSDEHEARAAQEALMERYGPAIRNYLLGALRDPIAAEELYQEFSLRFLRGDYASADASRGQFRNFLRTILVRLVVEFHRRRKRDKLVQVSDLPEQAVDDHEASRQFASVWRDALLQRAWQALAEVEQHTGRPLHTVMQQRVADPDLSSAQLAKQLTAHLGKSVTVANLRVILHRARHEFATLLLNEVANTLDQPQRCELEEELIELDLHKYCQAAL